MRGAGSFSPNQRHFATLLRCDFVMTGHERHRDSEGFQTPLPHDRSLPLADIIIGMAAIGIRPSCYNPNYSMTIDV